MFCSKCGTQMPDNAVFCPSCGFSATGQPAPAPAPAPIVKVETPESQRSAAYKAAQIGNIIAFGVMFIISLYVYIFVMQPFFVILVSLALAAAIAGFVFALISMKNIKVYGAANAVIEKMVNIFFYINIGMLVTWLLIF